MQEYMGEGPASLTAIAPGQTERAFLSRAADPPACLEQQHSLETRYSFRSTHMSNNILCFLKRSSHHPPRCHMAVAVIMETTSF